MSPDESHVADLIDASESIVRFTAGLSESEFRRGDLALSAILYKIVVLGEAVTRLSPGLCNRYPAIPWRDIRGMRNHLIHRYDKIDLAEAWRTSRVDVLALLERLREIQRDLQG
jgi:uncharacterized protein with HEPN domain